MKQIPLLLASLFFVTFSFSQTDSTFKTKKKDWSKVNMSNRAGDHFLVQVGYDAWAQAPDSLRIKGFSHSLNIYFMLDFPFKTDPRFSVGLGAGIGSSNIKFNKQEVNIISGGNQLPFVNKTDTNYFKKYKLVTTYLEAPVELRFTANPENVDKSFKIALGVKVGTLLNVHTRGKTLQNKLGSTLNNYVLKQSNKRFFNGTRFCATARIGYGHVSLFGQYQINNFIRDGLGPNIRPYSFGITFSGL